VSLARRSAAGKLGRHAAAHTFLAAALGLAMIAPQAGAGDAPAGRQKAGSCVPCHGTLGLSTLPNAPHLAGQPEIYLVEQLRAYRSGRRANEVMSVIAKPLTDRDIDDLAAWYGSIRIEAKPPD
jgi:cytochrome c553